MEEQIGLFDIELPILEQKMNMRKYINYIKFYNNMYADSLPGMVGNTKEQTLKQNNKLFENIYEISKDDEKVAYEMLHFTLKDRINLAYRNYKIKNILLENQYCKVINHLENWVLNV